MNLFDPVVISVFGLILLVVIVRIRMTYRKTQRGSDKGEHIQKKLAELRRLRDDQNKSDDYQL